MPRIEDQVQQTRPQHDEEQDGQEDERKRELDVGDAHDDVVDPAAEVARERDRARCR